MFSYCLKWQQLMRCFEIRIEFGGDEMWTKRNEPPAAVTGGFDLQRGLPATDFIQEPRCASELQLPFSSS